MMIDTAQTQAEKMVLGSCYGEDKLNQISFLEPADFTKKSHEVFFFVIRKCKSNLPDAFAMLKKEQKIGFIDVLSLATFPSACHQLQHICIWLVEQRFVREFVKLLDVLTDKSTDPIEIEILEDAKCNIIAGDLDVFELSEGLTEYLGIYCSEFSKQRIIDFNKWKVNRIEKMKKQIK